MSGREMIAKWVTERAAEILRARGWTQNTMGHSDRGPVCAAKALILAGQQAGDAHWQEPLGAGKYYHAGKELVLERLASMGDKRSLGDRENAPKHARYRYIVDWNDHPDTTEEHVLAVLEGRVEARRW